MRFNLEVSQEVMRRLQSEITALVSLMPTDLPRTAQAIADAAHDAHQNYNDYLVGNPIPGRGKLKRPAELFGGTICNPNGMLGWTIGHEDDKARIIEDGTPERDMKQDLPKAKKARRSKDGYLYLIIPFRHGSNTDGQGTRGFRPMPKPIYQMAARLQFSTHHGQIGVRLSATTHLVPRYGYSWGGRLPSGLAPKLKEHHKGDIYAGMYRFRDHGTPSMQRAAGYITFRTMSQKSDPRSWIRPAQPGLKPLETAMEQAWKDNEEALRLALEADLQALVS